MLFRQGLVTELPTKTYLLMITDPLLIHFELFLISVIFSGAAFQ